MDKIDKCITLIPHFLGIKVFPKGIHCLKQITAEEYAQTMKAFGDIVFNYTDILELIYIIVKPHYLSRYIYHAL